MKRVVVGVVVAARVGQLLAERIVRAVVADHAAHQMIARPLADERREPDDEMRVVGVAHEREPADARHLVLAARAPFDERGVQVAGKRAEAIGVEVEAADLAAERVDLGLRLVACVEREALHRVEVDVEPGEAAAHSLVEQLSTFVQRTATRARRMCTPLASRFARSFVRMATAASPATKRSPSVFQHRSTWCEGQGSCSTAAGSIATAASSSGGRLRVDPARSAIARAQASPSALSSKSTSFFESPMRFAMAPRGLEATIFAPASSTSARMLVTIIGPRRGPMPFSSMPT